MPNVPGATPLPSFNLEPFHSGEIEADELSPLILVTGIIDDSGSISHYNNDDAIRTAHNDLLDNYVGAAQSVLIRTRFLNGGGLSPEYQKPESAPRMDQINYSPLLGTPLYKQTPLALSEILSASRQFGKTHSVYTMTYLMTDGADTDGGDVAQIRDVVESMFASGRHVIAGIAVQDGHTDFRRVFRSMGIPEVWIKLLQRTNDDIRRGIGHFSKVTRNVTHVGEFEHSTFMGASQAGFTAVPNGDGASAIPGARTVGNMAGAMLQRTPQEKGEVPFAQISWSPVQLAYAFDRATNRWDNQNIMIPTPFSWDTRHGMYLLKLPAENVAYIIGRGGGAKWDASTLARIQSVIDNFYRYNPEGKLYYVPLNELGNQLSRTHALITHPKGVEKCDIRALKGDVTVIMDDDPAHDCYLQADRNEVELVEGDIRIKLTPNVVFRTI